MPYNLLISIFFITVILEYICKSFLIKIYEIYSVE